MIEPTTARIAAQLTLPVQQVAAAIDLFDNGNTLAFHRPLSQGSSPAGWMKNRLRAIQETLESQRALDERRAVIIASIGEQGRLTPELALQLEAGDQPHRTRRSLCALQAQAANARQHRPRVGRAAAGRPDSGAKPQPGKRRSAGAALPQQTVDRQSPPFSPVRGTSSPRPSATTPACAPRCAPRRCALAPLPVSGIDDAVHDERRRLPALLRIQPA
jgi:hypothetical protein